MVPILSINSKFGKIFVQMVLIFQQKIGFIEKLFINYVFYN